LTDKYPRFANELYFCLWYEILIYEKLNNNVYYLICQYDSIYIACLYKKREKLVITFLIIILLYSNHIVYFV
jgi:hypothetical protein